jgi:murein DD-endopeptidase MepM/ murein hydrolase activator NlpD
MKPALPLTLAVVLASATVPPADAQSIPIGFPISGQNPYTAPIITVLDHSTDYFYDKNQGQVAAYTGEQGVRTSSMPCGPSGLPPCGYYNLNFVPNDTTSTLQFIVNGNYTGVSADAPDQYKVLNYRGHSGYDYGYGAGTVIVAAQSGTLYVPANDPVNDPGGNDPWCTFHSFYIDHGNGWTTWYLHAARLLVGVSPHGACTNGIASNIRYDEPIAHVSQGQSVAVVGNFANGVAGGVGYHLHFEVRRGCDLSSGAVKQCMVVDPYGWEWVRGDPIANNVCAPNPLNQQICATAQSAPLWDLNFMGVQQPVVTNVAVVPSSGGFSATITGQNFASGALVTLWSAQGRYFFPPALVPTSATNTQLVVQLPNPPVQDPTMFVLKVRNPGGPRSVGVPLTLSGESSVPLILNGQPAPGGGDFAGFAGFWSLTERGDGVFNAGVDTNGDGTPDYFADFEFSGGEIIKPSIPGFGNISSVVTHIRINNNGDLAFGDVNGVYGASPAGIYIAKSDNSPPITVVQWGQACPSPCPVSGSPSIYQLYGPLAFDDAENVAFATSLFDPQKNVTYCCFLFLYSGASGTITKVAADGPGGDLTPVGGTFTSGTLDPPITQITSDGDVIFLAQVTGGTSQGGIFRYSRTQGLSKIVVQGDAAPVPGGGTLGFPLFGKTGSVSGRQLVFHAPVVSGSSRQLIGMIKDVSQSPIVKVYTVAYEGESTGTSVSGIFSANGGLPFGGYGQNTAPPCTRRDGAVVFHSLLVGAHTASGVPTGEGIFLWNSNGFQKIVVDGDSMGSGASIQGVFASDINSTGEVLYSAASVQ